MQSPQQKSTGFIFFKIGMAILTAPIWLGLFVLMLPELLLAALALVLRYLVAAVLGLLAIIAGGIFRIGWALRDGLGRLRQSP
jgi:hypothetical protein